MDRPIHRIPQTIIFIALVCLATWLAPCSAVAQETPPTGTEASVSTERSAQVKLEGWNRALDSMLNALGREGIDDDQLAALSDDVAAIQAEATRLLDALTPQLSRLQSQMDELGEADPRDSPAAQELTGRRNDIQEALKQADALAREARLVIVRVGQIESAILSERRQRFVVSLTQRSYSILDPALWIKAAEGLPRYWRSLSLQVRDSASYAWRQIVETPLSQLLLAGQLVIIIVIYTVLNRGLRHSRAQPALAPGEAWAATVMRRLAILGILPALLTLALGYWLAQASLVSDKIGILIVAIAQGLALFIIGVAFAMVFLAPSRPDRRLAKLSDPIATEVYRTLTGGIAGVAFFFVLSFSASQLVAPFAVSVAISALLALTCFTMVLRCLFVIRRETNAQFLLAAGRGLISWRNYVPILWAGCLGGMGALAAGYVAMAEFIAFQIIFISIAIQLLWLVQRLIDDFRMQVVGDPQAGVAGTLPAAGSSRQFAVLGIGLLRLAAILVVALVVLIPWGLQKRDLLVLLQDGFFEFTIGDLTISVADLLTGIVVLVVGAAATRQIQQWFSNQYLPTTSLDPGLRNSIATIIGYVGITIAALLAITAAGVNFQSITLVAGALTLGIGFGLQSIVNNFVSGLILLAERPIKAGDWVVTGGGQGTVRRIAVRSTEIETFDGATVIVPNSTLISESVLNWTHRDTKGRIIMTIGVAYGSDPDQVRDILLKVAEAHPLVVERPQPVVFFMDFGADALIFDLRAYLADVGYTLSVTSDLRFATLRALREANIEIPFPQRDIHIKSGLPAPGGPPKDVEGEAGGGKTTRRRQGHVKHAD